MASGISMKGREVILTIGGQNILGIQSKGLTVNNEFIESTDDNSGGWTEFDAIPGVKNAELTFSGMVKNLEMLRAILTAGSNMFACTLTYKDGSVAAGDFAMNSYSDTGGNSNEGYTFDVTLASSGVVTFTAGTGG
jgi:predicted secreted protein